MSETAYAFAVRTLAGDPDVTAIVRCSSCDGLGYTILFYTYWTGHYLRECSAEEPCERCMQTGCERIERRSEEPIEIPVCYGEDRGRIRRRLFCSASAAGGGKP